MKGKIVLVPFPFTDLTVAKLRPALVIHESAKDVVIAFISSKVPVEPSDTEVHFTPHTLRLTPHASHFTLHTSRP